MPRRASATHRPLRVVVILSCVGAVIAAGYWAFAWVSDPFRAVPTLEVPAYLDNSNSLRGNTYKLTGMVLNSLGWSQQDGRLFSVQTESGGAVLPILIPAPLNHINVQKGQQFHFKVEVDNHGILVVSSLQKR